MSAGDQTPRFLSSGDSTSRYLSVLESGPTNGHSKRTYSDSQSDIEVFIEEDGKLKTTSTLVIFAYSRFFTLKDKRGLIISVDNLTNSNKHKERVKPNRAGSIKT